jgi:hypothetical protein
MTNDKATNDKGMTKFQMPNWPINFAPEKASDYFLFRSRAVNQASRRSGQVVTGS